MHMWFVYIYIFLLCAWSMWNFRIIKQITKKLKGIYLTEVSFLGHTLWLYLEKNYVFCSFPYFCMCMHRRVEISVLGRWIGCITFECKSFGKKSAELQHFLLLSDIFAASFQGLTWNDWLTETLGLKSRCEKNKISQVPFPVSTFFMLCIGHIQPLRRQQPHTRPTLRELLLTTILLGLAKHPPA